MGSDDGSMVELESEGGKEAVKRPRLFEREQGVQLYSRCKPVGTINRRKKTAKLNRVRCPVSRSSKISIAKNRGGINC